MLSYLVQISILVIHSENSILINTNNKLNISDYRYNPSNVWSYATVESYKAEWSTLKQTEF